MKEPNQYIAEAFYTALNGTVTYAGAVVPIYDIFRDDRPDKYIYISNQNSTQVNTKSNFMYECNFTLTIVTLFNKDDGGFLVCDAISQSILALLVNNLTVSNFQVVDQHFENSLYAESKSGVKDEYSKSLTFNLIVHES